MFLCDPVEGPSSQREAVSSAGCAVVAQMGEAFEWPLGAAEMFLREEVSE